MDAQKTTSAHNGRLTDEGLASLADRGVGVLRAIHPDLFGRQRAKQIPIERGSSLNGALAYSKMAMAEDLMGIPLDAQDFPQLASHPDVHARVDASTVRFPNWEPDCAWLLSSLWEKDGPSPLCARTQLKSAGEQLLADTGLRAIAAGEPEFYLFEQADGQPYSKRGSSYTVDRVTDPRGVVGRMHRALIDFDIGVTVLSREFSPGQFEINLHHDDVLAAADKAFLLKCAVKDLASIEGLDANFMAKPRSGSEGNGLHVHVSLWDGETNAFAKDGDELSDTALAAIAGLQAHAPELMAVAAPTVNSYKRLTGEGLSPRNGSWGKDDRRAFIRIPPDMGAGTRVELRCGDASASPHLLFAATLHAMRSGITNEMRPTRDGGALPSSLEEAVQAFEGSEIMKAGFGEEFVGVYAALKRREIAAFHSHVTDWERDLYGIHA
ncbi:glutamine synthetase family protein [Modestobacter sp. VKM Ac-2978]|uniref:glutamine synthetase family protein n=1 Tax=Modestobacter sp. VKM Ac-2978 TaxID=3004132 RepID=UPI0022AA2389|nr:glutamine synthetase family protein [Modestobacter sp. VKM Ac-2978]MCZ2849871.1 glutamine synthetase family protein [Modestobacter sp. VKM Ac-2978]